SPLAGSKTTAVTKSGKAHFGEFRVDVACKAQQRLFREDCSLKSRLRGTFLYFHLRYRPEYPDLRGLAGVRRNRQEKTVELRNEDRGPRPGSRRQALDAAIAVAAHIEDVDEARPAADIDAPALGVDEQVVCIPARLKGRDRGTPAHREHAEARRASEH